MSECTDGSSRNFEWAVEQLKRGKRVAREEWIGRPKKHSGKCLIGVGKVNKMFQFEWDTLSGLESVREYAVSATDAVATDWMVVESEAPEVDGNPASKDGTFGAALEWLKDGKKITRAGWNGKGLCVYLPSPDAYPMNPSSEVQTWRQFMVITTVEGSLVPWVPSVSDCLAGDWRVVE